MYIDAWSMSLPEESALVGADRCTEPPLSARGSLFELSECDLSDLPEDAQDAVLLAGALLQAYLEAGRRLAEA